MKLRRFFLTFATFLLFLSGCSKQSSQFDLENTINIELAQGDEKELISNPQKWQLNPNKICVIFGYDFNNQETTSELISLLEENYGLSENSGLIYPLIFPEDFKTGGRSYQTNLRLFLQNDINNLIGLVILGAPERTHYALARNQDYWDMNVPYPIISLFPQDDVLGLEAACDIVLDKGQNANFSGEVLEEETEGSSIPEAPEILINTIDYMLTMEGPFPKDKILSSHVHNMYKNFKIHHYTDPETGLQSINHFVLN